MDRLLRALVEGGQARIVAAVTTGACCEASRRQEAAPAAAVALARAQTAAALLATLAKGDERVTLQILGRGPLGTIAADANDRGDVRGLVTGRHAPLAAPGDGRLRLGPLVGAGMVSVIRDLGPGDCYRGASPLVSGEIDEDIEAHLTASEEVMSALQCDGVVRDGALAAAGGVLVQCLPGGDLEAVEAARARLRQGGVHAALAAGIDDPDALVREVLDVAPRVLEVRPVRFFCSCSRERVLGALRICGAAELRDMLREQTRGSPTEVTCNFCGTRYAVGVAELVGLIESLARA